LTASASFISKALTIVISFVSVPLTVHYLGSERYGVWLTIGSLLTWMSMTDFGIAGNALVNLLADAHGKEDKRLAGQHAASAFWALVGLSLCIGGIFLFSFHYIPWQEVFHVSSAVPGAELSLACAYSLIFFVVGFPLSMVSSVYGAYQDGFMANIWNIAGSAIALISLIVVAQMKGGLPHLAYTAAFGSALVFDEAPVVSRRQLHDYAVGGSGHLSKPTDDHYADAGSVVRGHFRGDPKDRYSAHRPCIYGYGAIHFRLWRSQGESGLGMDQRGIQKLTHSIAGLRHSSSSYDCAGG
jgi:hypothetical protein